MAATHQAQGENVNVEDLITSRILEWRNLEKVKREKEMEEIERRKQFPLDSFPVGTFDRLKGTQMWNMILDKLENPLDVSSASHACPHFNDLLHERMLTEVFKVLRDNNYIHLQYDGNTNYFQMSDLQNVLQLRLVCKAWKEVVKNLYLDSFQGDWKLNFLYDSLYHLDQKNALPTWHKAFHTFKFNVNSVPPSDHNHSLLSPNLMRMVYVKDSDDQNKKEETLRLLHTHGHLVQGLCFIAREEDSSVSKCQRLLSLLNEVKNVKALVLLMNTKSIEDDAAELLDYLRDSRFPVMPSVEFLKFESTMENDAFVAEILRKCPNLKSLHLPANQPIQGELACILQNLKLQHFRMDQPGMFEDPIAGQSDLLRRAPWHLKSFILHHGSVRNGNLFRKISRFGDHLENLDLDMPVMPPMKTITISLPRLKRLHLGLIYRYTSLDYLLPLTTLEHLEICTVGDCELPNREGEHRKHVINFGEHMHNLEECNIWKLLPHLKSVRFQNVGLKYQAVQYIKRGNDVIKSIKTYKHGDSLKWSWSLSSALSTDIIGRSYNSEESN